MKPLIYPLVQVVIGAAKLVPTPKYYPLRFHCARILRDVSSNTGTFIPVLPFYLEVLNSYNFGKKIEESVNETDRFFLHFKAFKITVA